MGTSLSVKINGSWETVDEPFINDNGTWKTIHTIWVKHGGTWRLAHKTGQGQYPIYTSQEDIMGSGSITIAEHVRYMKVVIVGSGGGGGGGRKTSGSWSDGHATCSGGVSDTNNRVIDTVYGGPGGAGGVVQVMLEVKYLEEYSWSWNTYGTGGPSSSAWHLAHNSSYTVGSTMSGTGGTSASGMTFTGSNNTNITVGGGGGGSGGTLTLSAQCSGSGAYGQTVSTTTGATGGAGQNSIAGDKITNVIANTSGGGATGGAGGLAGSTGSPGYFEVHQYRASKF